MTKPRIFIGSSVEGLNVSYAVQQNLFHDAEVTVWDQDVFQLSRTTMESLTDALRDSDFAIFIFSSDDLATIRKETVNIIRDNVLFELGLFIGKLGRERVFFLVPHGGELHIPTDLLGITPGKYDSTRSDGLLKAGTGPVCHQIRNQIKSLGVVPGRIVVEASNDGGVVEKNEENFWIIDFVEGNYKRAKITLEQQMSAQSGEEAIISKSWLAYCDFKLEKIPNTKLLTDFANTYPKDPIVQSSVGMFLRREGYIAEAIQFLSSVQLSLPNDSKIAQALAACYVENENNLLAIEKLLHATPDDSPEIAIDLASAFEREDRMNDALKTIQRCHIKFPRHTELRFKYARLAQELDLHNIAACLLIDLTEEKPENIEYWGYLGNSCLQLDMQDTALAAYRKAEKIMKIDAPDQWIIGNIGNLLINKGLSIEACVYLERAVKYQERSEYCHGRLSDALKNKATERKEFEKKYADGKRQIIEAAQALSLEEKLPTT
ncbi:nucleotide-binding protein [Janthinobacterium rivuli]|uniref:Nucleotide-binding protein n=1 Tax=Janthinobacterium rivuli TaxID=2751478 RepID=A0ABY8I908_9BURK|nr:TIR domain-containing protein [Janthinobacterium rivuli]WFR81416.1 nucleotide-binding protein [Janthinobacterium rivuli]